MLAGAITVSPLGALVAFGAGILSFLSPCVLPLVPGYLSLVSGLSAAELGASGAVRAPEPAGDRAAAAHQLVLAGQLTASATSAISATSAASAPRADPVRERRPLVPMLRGILLFVAGFTVVFVALGATASGVHTLLSRHLHTLTLASGAVVVTLGVVMLATSLPAGVWSRLGPRVAGRAAWIVGERRVHVRPETFGAWAAPVMGMAFAFAWTPCIGPVLGAVLALTMDRSTLGGGTALLLAYSLGLGVPFVVTGLAFDRVTAFYARARRPLALLQGAAAVVLVAFGAILLAGDLGWLSAQFSSLLDHLGLQRLTVS
ncbi:MAG: cytochrome c biogenesis CcdA family protein [Acidimicrobiales bacterium]